MNDSGSRTVVVAKNTFWNLVAKGADFTGNLLASVLIARTLGVDGFGQFSFVVAFATMFSMGMDWGLDHILVREISRRPGDGKLEFGTVLGLKFLFLIAMIPILVAANHGLSLTQDVRLIIYVAAASIMVFRVGFTRIAEGVLLARDSLSQKALVTVLYQIIRLAGVAWVLWIGGNLILLFVVLLSADLFQALLVGILVHRRHIPISFRFPKQDIGFFFTQAMPLGIALACNGAYIQQDILILKAFTDDVQIGLFSSGYRIIVAMVAFITPAFAVLLPEFSRKAVESKSHVSVLGGKIAQWFLAATIPGVVLLALVAKPILVFLYGQSFAAAAPVIQLLSAVVFLRSLEYLFAVGLVSVNRSWWVLITAGSSLVINVSLNLILIPRFGFMGAVYSKLASEIVVFCVSLTLFQIAVKGSLFPKWILQPIGAGLIMLTAMFLSWQLGAIPAFAIGMGVYGLSFVVIGYSQLKQNK